MHKHAVFLGFCGLIPFLFLPLATETNHLALFEGVAYFGQYSAIILSFLGGVLWYDALINDKPAKQLYLAMLPSIFAWSGLVLLPPFNYLFLMLFCFIGLLIVEQLILKTEIWYVRLRLLLTSIVVGCHLVMIWQLI